jgi:DNA-binding NarL/FixJ family response regulator
VTSRPTPSASARRAAPLRVLVVDPDAAFRNAVRHTLRKLAVVDEACSREEATAILSRGASYGAFIVEVALPDGSGLDWLASTRWAHHDTLCLVVASKLDPALVNRVFALGGRLHCKPLPFRSLQSFVKDAARRIRSAPSSRTDRIEACVRQWTEQLSPTEIRIVAMAVVHMKERREIASDLGLSENTVKTHVKKALRKLAAKSMADLRIRAEAFEVEKPRQPARLRVASP